MRFKERKKRYFRVKNHTDGVHIIYWDDGCFSIATGILEKGCIRANCYAVLNKKKVEDMIAFLQKCRQKQESK